MAKTLLNSNLWSPVTYAVAGIRILRFSVQQHFTLKHPLLKKTPLLEMGERVQIIHEFWDRRSVWVLARTGLAFSWHDDWGRGGTIFALSSRISGTALRFRKFLRLSIALEIWQRKCEVHEIRKTVFGGITDDFIGQVKSFFRVSNVLIIMVAIPEVSLSDLHVFPHRIAKNDALLWASVHLERQTTLRGIQRRFFLIALFSRSSRECRLCPSWH